MKCSSGLGSFSWALAARLALRPGEVGVRAQLGARLLHHFVDERDEVALHGAGHADDLQEARAVAKHPDDVGRLDGQVLVRGGAPSPADGRRRSRPRPRAGRLHLDCGLDDVHQVWRRGEGGGEGAHPDS